MKGDFWPSNRERDIFERGYRLAIEDAATVAETMPDLVDYDNPSITLMPSPEDVAAAIRKLSQEGPQR